MICSSFSLFATMKRRLSISCDILLDTLGKPQPSITSELIKRLKSEEEADPGDEAAPSTVPEYNYFSTNNRLMEYDWTNKFTQLPEKLVEILEAAKEPSILNRLDTMPTGKSPFFAIKYGLVPKKTWDNEFKLFLLEAPEACVITEQSLSLDYKRHATQLQPEHNVHPQPSPTDDQKQLIDRIEYLMREPFKNFHLISLQGAAGTGKTFVLSQFRERATYITTTNVLCNDVKIKYGVSTMTLCKFLMESLQLNFLDVQLLQDLIKHVPHDAFHRKNLSSIISFGGRANRWKYVLRKMKRLHVFVNRGSKTMLYFLDEFSQMSSGIIGLVTEILRLTSIYMNMRIVLVISGDANQIPPLFIVPTHSFDFIQQCADYSFTFNQQMRCLDANYLKILNRILHEKELRTYTLSVFKDIDSADIEYNYPIALVQTAPTKTTDLIKWIYENDIINISSLIFFSFTNRELHFNNISMGVAVWRQLKLYTIPNIQQYVQFQILLSKRDGRAETFSYKFPLDEQSTSRYIRPTPYILPLVKFFPYKILTRDIPNLPRSSIVLLLAWNDKRVAVLDLRDKSIHAFGPANFRMNLNRCCSFRGFPMQMHIGETSYSCQGMTITRGICVNASKATREELYVTLSRVRTLGKCIRVHVP